MDRLRNLLAYLVLGVVTSLASSVVFAQSFWWNLWIDESAYTEYRFFDEEGHLIWWDYERVPGYTRLYVDATTTDRASSSGQRASGPQDSPLWLDLELKDGEDWNVIAVGWPWRALKCAEAAQFETGYRQWGAWRIRWENSDQSEFPPAPPHLIILPYLPIWTGLTLNTGFYAVLWWLGLGAARVVRQNRRFQRGQCPICRYDLKADYSRECPECGSKVRGSAM